LKPPGVGPARSTIFVTARADAQFINPRYGRVLQEWEKYYQAGLRAYEQDNFAEARQQFLRAREEVKKFGPDDPRMATILNDLAKVYHAEGKYADAALLYRQSLAIDEKALGPDDLGVAEALAEINSRAFDLLIADLNIGQVGDGFTVVSAMRRVQPEAATFILTGYPDFDTALQAIRGQVDDYLLKPADVPTLIRTIKHRVDNRRPLTPERPLKRVSHLMQESLGEITREWLRLVKEHPEIAAIPISDKERIDHLPSVIKEMARRVDIDSDTNTRVAKAAAMQHGQDRARQGYNIPLIVIEMRLLQHVLSTVLQHNLIRMDLSTVIGDMMQVGESLQEQLEFSIRGFQQDAREAA